MGLLKIGECSLPLPILTKFIGNLYILLGQKVDTILLGNKFKD